MDAGLLVLRLVTGLLLAAHGTQKLFGWFGGNGLDRTSAWFESMNFFPGRLMACVASGAEIVAGTLLALGLVTPLASAAITGTLVVAMYTHRRAGLWSSKGGFELALLYTSGAVGIGLCGAGTFSLDHALRIPHTSNAAVAAVAIAVAAAGSAGVILQTRLQAAARSESVS